MPSVITTLLSVLVFTIAFASVQASAAAAFKGTQVQTGSQPGAPSLLASDDIFYSPKSFLLVSLPVEPRQVKGNTLEVLSHAVRSKAPLHLPTIAAELEEVVGEAFAPVVAVEAEDMLSVLDHVEVERTALDWAVPENKAFLAQLNAFHARLAAPSKMMAFHFDSLAALKGDFAAYSTAVGIADRFTKKAMEQMAAEHGEAAHTQVVLTASDPITEFDAANYQLLLWTAVILVFSAFFAVYLTNRIDYSGDSLLYVTEMAKDY